MIILNIIQKIIKNTAQKIILTQKITNMINIFLINNNYFLINYDYYFIVNYN